MSSQDQPRKTISALREEGSSHLRGMKHAILEEPGDIVASIRSTPNTPRKCATEEKTLIELRAKVEKHIKNSYLKRVDAPVGVKPALKCWMELN